MIPVHILSNAKLLWKVNILTFGTQLKLLSSCHLIEGLSSDKKLEKINYANVNKQSEATLAHKLQRSGTVHSRSC